jgi:insulysin
MNALLVNDPEADMSAASMYVGVGSLSDPDDSSHHGEKFNGLAHFCEHMLFLGTKKYPNENYYQKFLEDNGGDSNAATGDDYTYFYFDISNQKFGEALDIFSQFFKEPLFNKESMDREMKAIDSEY